FANSTAAGSTVSLALLDGGGTNVISTYANSSAAFAPRFVDKTRINGQGVVVVQLAAFSLSAGHHTFYASSIGTWTEIVSTYSSIAHRGKIEHIDGYALQM